MLTTNSALLALGSYGILYLIQLLIADGMNIYRKHTPGMPILTGHDDFHFRAHRVHSKTTETIGAFILIAGFAFTVDVEPQILARTLWAFVLARVLHMVAYYLDWRRVRPLAFALSIIALFVLFGEGIRAL